jgi:hypothetical protein
MSDISAGKAHPKKSSRERRMVALPSLRIVVLVPPHNTQGWFMSNATRSERNKDLPIQIQSILEEGAAPDG